MKIACIEDNKDDLEAVKRIIRGFDEIDADYFYNTTKIVESCEKYDAIITDIDVPIENGLIIGRKLRNHGYEKPILLMSWHYGFEHESFAIHPFCFIRKEYLSYEMRLYLSDLLREYHRGHDIFEYEDRNGNKMKIHTTDILYFERYKNTVEMYLKQGVVECISYSLKAILSQDISGFYQINKSIIINFYNVQKYPEKGEFILYGGVCLSASRSRRDELHKAYLMFNY